jgi:hypothetical protein
LHSVDVTRADGDTFRVRAVVHNEGWMPTQVTEKALQRKVVRPIEATIALPEGGSLVQGRARLELGQLAGWSRARSVWSWVGSTDDTGDRAKAEWVVRAPAGSTVEIEFRHQRAGVVRTQATLA